MSRPCKCRRIGYLPAVTIFKPAGIPLRELEVISLSYEEVEAIRLKDMEGLEQKPAAEKMNISRPTFQRILSSARQKLADAVLNGKAIRIEGGNFEISIRRFRCNSGHEWNIPLNEVEVNPPLKCPVCETLGISPVSLPVIVCAGKGRCHRRDSGWQKTGLQSEELLTIRPPDQIMDRK